MKKFLLRWLAFQQRQKVLFISIITGLMILGGFIAYQSQIEAFPELTNVQVQVITQFPGKAAEEVERQVTVPLEVATIGTSGLINQRSISIFGLSVITLTFDDDVPLEKARINISQRLADADLPEGVKPGLSPESTPIGEIFRYTVESDLPVDELRMIEDWRLEREFKSIPGVADVVSFGGPTRTIEVQLDSRRMSALGLTVDGVAQALAQNHANAGGSLVAHGQEAYVVRSIGMYENPESLEFAVIGTQHNQPIHVRDIGQVRLGHHLRLGQVGRDNLDDVVQGIILLRKGHDTLGTCEKIREKIDELNRSMPSMKIVPYYDRTDLIKRSSHTVFHNIGFGVVLVSLMLAFGFGFAYWPLILGVMHIIPFALLMAFIGMKIFHYSPNLISLGAIDFGIIVETAIFAVEAVIAELVAKNRKDHEALSDALKDVLGPALLCALLLLIAFVPILSLQRVEGRIFKPLGITLVSALIGGQLGALIFIPFFTLLSPVGPQKESILEDVFDFLTDRAERLAQDLARRIKKPAAVFGAIFLVLLFGLNYNLGHEFLPQLNEGALWVRAIAPPTISREAAVELGSKIRSTLKQIPEVTHVVSQIGRPDDGTDINGFNNIELFVDLADPSRWKTASTIDGFIKKAQALLADIPGVDFSFSQPIKDNVDEAISGVKGELVVKIFGPDLRELQKYADQISEVVRKIPGAQDVTPEDLLGQPELRFDMHRDILARYGLRITDAEQVLENALLGKFATKMMDPQGRFVEVLVKPQLPEEPNDTALASLPVLSPEGPKIQLKDVSFSHLVEGVSRIYRELSQRRVAVKCSVRGRAVVEFVQEANRAIQKVKMPPEYRVVWSGSFENAKRASRQLMILVPICVGAMVIILYSWFGRWSTVGLLLWEVPFSMAGGLAALRLLGLSLTISAAAGAIVVMGVSFLTGMMLISGWTACGSVWLATKNEGRGILLSNGVAIAGLIPAAFSHGIGAEVARPFAVTILGGLITSLVFTLILLPVLISKKIPTEVSNKEIKMKGN